MLPTMMPGRQRSRTGATLSSRRGSKPHFSRSKKGCLTCRQRRVKCGEEQPECANCGRLYLNCVYAKDPTAAHGADLDQPLDIHPTTFSHPSPEPNSQTAPTSQKQPQYPSSIRAMSSSVPSRRTIQSPKSQLSSPRPPTVDQPEMTSGPSSSLDQLKLEIHTQGAIFPQQRPIQLSVQDASLIGHFLEILAPTSKAIEPQQPNFLMDLFAKSLFCEPLYDGIMAYSALHLSRLIDRPDLLTVAHSKHQKSLTILQCSWAISVASFNVDLILPTLVIYALWEVSHGTTAQTLDVVFNMAREAVTSTNQTFANLTCTGQSCAIILARLCLTSSSFGARVPKFAHWLLQSVSGPSDGDSLFVNTPAVHVDWLQLYQFAARVSMLDRKLQSFRNTITAVEQLDTAMQEGRTILQCMISFKGQLDRGGDNFQQFCYTDKVPTVSVNFTPHLLNLVHKTVFVNSLIIYLGRIMHCRPQGQYSSYSSKIVTTAARMAQSGEDPSYHIFPWCLVLAGLEASSLQDYRWITARFDCMASAGWISTKPKLVMDQIREEEVKSGRAQLSEIILRSKHLVVL